MSNQEINIAIAERQGMIKPCEIGWYVLTGPNIGQYSHDAITRLTPNYSGDLNAMHEVEKGLDKFQRPLYQFTLAEIIGDLTKAIHATARQRAEAYLKTVGGWTEC